MSEQNNDVISIDERFDNIRVMIKDALKEWYCRGYEDGVKATNVDCGVVWEERIEDIKAEIQTLRNCSCSCSDGIIDDVEDIIDKHISGKDNDLGDYPDTIPNQFDNMTGSMNL